MFGDEEDLGNKKFRHIAQIGMVVKDIEEARAAWAELLGVEKPPIVETEGWESSRMTFKGKPSEGRAKLSFFDLENIVVELIQPISGPSTWRDFVEKYGEGVHHIAFNIENLEETLERFKKIGILVEQRGDYEGGCYVYTDSKRKLGATIELLHSHG
jgi:methylmalonyl-CoA/ethylmalonyl-CoA epimerase